MPYHSDHSNNQQSTTISYDCCQAKLSTDFFIQVDSDFTSLTLYSEQSGTLQSFVS